MKQVFGLAPPPAHAFPSGFLRVMSSGHMETYCSSETLWSVLCWDAQAHGSQAKEIEWWWHSAVGPASPAEQDHAETSPGDAATQEPHAWHPATVFVVVVWLVGSIPINVTWTNIITNTIFSLPRPAPPPLMPACHMLAELSECSNAQRTKRVCAVHVAQLPSSPDLLHQLPGRCCPALELLLLFTFSVVSVFFFFERGNLFLRNFTLGWERASSETCLWAGATGKRRTCKF